MTEKDISLFLHKRGFAVLMLMLVALLAWVAFVNGRVEPLGSPLGVGVPAARTWISLPFYSLLASVLSTAAIVVLIIWINRAFNVLRSLTLLVASMFFAMQAGLPSVLGCFYGGDLMGVLVAVCVGLLFNCYGNDRCQRSVYQIFLIITAAGFTDMSFLLYLPVFFVGCVQMRVMSLRTFLAAAMGVITPPWIIFGLGLLNPATDLHWPRLVMAWKMFDNPEVVQALICTGFTIAVAIFFTVANLLKILSYNSQVRAYNGFLTLSLIATALFTALNFNNFSFYVPLLNCLTAYQIAHFFTYRRTRRSYIPIMLLILAYLGFYAWSLLY